VTCTHILLELKHTGSTTQVGMLQDEFILYLTIEDMMNPKIKEAK